MDESSVPVDSSAAPGVAELIPEQNNISENEFTQMPPQELINVLGEADFSTSELETPLIVSGVKLSSSSVSLTVF
jgi:hypothetical protein